MLCKIEIKGNLILHNSRQITYKSRIKVRQNSKRNPKNDGLKDRQPSYLKNLKIPSNGKVLGEKGFFKNHEGYTK